MYVYCIIHLHYKHDTKFSHLVNTNFVKHFHVYLNTLIQPCYIWLPKKLGIQE